FDDTDGVEDTKSRGFVTSVVHSPTLDATIGLAYVRTALTEPGSRVHTGDGVRAEVVAAPFVPTAFPPVAKP
ncbi:MAG: glycine cleavage T C-terminal barrel domain-containing protein, partial [Candidatus Poribacteria bacterium]